MFGYGLAQTILKLSLFPEKLKLSTRVILLSLGLEVVNFLGVDMADGSGFVVRMSIHYWFVTNIVRARGV